MKDYIIKIISDSLKLEDASQLKIENPKDPTHGDLSTNVALIFAKKAGKNPREFAQELINSLNYDSSKIAEVSIAGPGFINFKINDNYYKDSVAEIISSGENFGKLKTNEGKAANLEWVSANPTGPLHAGHGRNIALGKAIANLLEWSGYKVTREYYYNDAGSQMDKLAMSIQARYKQIFDDNYPFPEEGYKGEYINEIAQTIYELRKDDLKNSDDLGIFKTAGENYNFKLIRKVLSDLGIEHDVFYNETELYTSGKIENLIKDFKLKNIAYEKDGATWLKMDESEGFDKDKVIVKSTGEPTYRLPDMAYHIDKIERGFDLIVDIFGADHGDTYKEVLYGVRMAGYDSTKIKVIIHQMVTFKIGNESVKMSKRSDNVYYLEDLINDVGADATQFFFVMRSANTHLDFDIALAKEQSDKNPVYYLQYAHARICGIIRNAETNFEEIAKSNEFDTSLIGTPEEMRLIKTICRFPEVVSDCSQNLEPHKMITYLNEVASDFHAFYHNNRVLDEDNPATSKTRLALCKATRIVLANGFNIIGISAPEKM